MQMSSGENAVPEKQCNFKLGRQMIDYLGLLIRCYSTTLSENKSKNICSLQLA